MNEKIINFINTLRKSSIRISISESIDAYNALFKIDITDKDLFKSSLKYTLIKDISDERLFDQIFDLYFMEPIEKEEKQLSDEEFEQLWDNMQNNELNNFDNIQQEQEYEQEYSNSSPSEKEFFNNQSILSDEEKIQNMYLRGSNEEIDNFSKEQADKVDLCDCKDILTIDQIVNAIMNKNKMDLIKKNTKNKIPQKQEKFIDEKYEKIKEKIKEQIIKNMVIENGEDIINDIMKSDDLYDKQLGSLSFDELEKVQEIIKKMSKKIMCSKSLKNKESKKGNINIKSTIKHSITNGTTCSNLKFKKRKNTKNKLVVLCDISGSVYLYVDFMLQLTIGINKAFKHVNSYVFIDRIKNINYIMDLNAEKIHNELEKIIFSNKLGYNTDYTNSFIEFLNEKNVLDKQTVLIVMGDAENTNRNDKGEEYFKQITNKCKTTIWLNPNKKELWYNGISCLKEYEKYCKNVYECSTLRQLELFIKKLIRIK